MEQVRWIRTCGLAAVATLLSIGLAAQTGDPATLIKKKLARIIRM